jgi:hypothetical protein
MTASSQTSRYVFICAALSVLTLAIYYQVHTFDFVSYDDPNYVYRNLHVQAGITVGSVDWALTAGRSANWHPLTWLSHTLDWQLFGANAGGPHTVNLIFHIANTLLLFLVLTRMTNALWQSAFVAALFALHPLHVESVAWVSERKDVLSTFFWMLTMWAYLWYVRKPGAARYLLALLMFALGLTAKPMLVTLPFVLLLLDYWPLERIGAKQQKTQGRERRRTFYRLVYEKVPFTVLSAASSIITFVVQQGRDAMVPLSDLPLKYRIGNAFISYAEYIEKMFWPSGLAVFYRHPGRNISIAYAAIAALLLAAATILILRLSRNRRYLITGWFWYLGTLVPVIGLVQVGVQGLADRYTYVPLIGLFIMIAWGVPDLLAKLRYRKTILACAAILTVAGMSLCTYVQLGYWKNTLTLFEHALTVTKKNYIAMENLAWFMSVDPGNKAYNPSKAIQLAQQGCEITHYNNENLLDTLAVSYAAAGDFTKAIGAARMALKLCQSPELKKEIEERLNLYRAGRPYIESE